MLNPILRLAKHYNPFRSPVTMHRCADGLTIELRSPLKSARGDWYSLHDCHAAEKEHGTAVPSPCVNLQIGDRVVSMFANDACLSLSHKAPRAYFRDEARISDMCPAEWPGAEPSYPRWSGTVLHHYIAPLSITIDTAARQERGLADYRAKTTANTADV